MNDSTLKVTQPLTYLKAIYATVIGFLGALATVMVGDVGLGDVTQGQWVIATVAALSAGGGVMGLTNRPVR